MKAPTLRYAKTTVMGESWWAWKCDLCHPESGGMVDPESGGMVDPEILADAQASCPYRRGFGHWFPPIPEVDAELTHNPSAA